MSADTSSRLELELDLEPEPDAEHHAELADMVATMSVTPSRLTPPNGFRSGPPRTTGSYRASQRKMSLQERGRIARQPTIETKRVSITDADVSRPELRECCSELHWLFYVFIYFLQDFVQLNQYKMNKEIGKASVHIPVLEEVLNF